MKFFLEKRIWCATSNGFTEVLILILQRCVALLSHQNRKHLKRYAFTRLYKLVSIIENRTANDAVKFFHLHNRNVINQRYEENSE